MSLLGTSCGRAAHFKLAGSWVWSELATCDLASAGARAFGVAVVFEQENDCLLQTCFA